MIVPCKTAFYKGETRAIAAAYAALVGARARLARLEGFFEAAKLPQNRMEIDEIYFHADRKRCFAYERIFSGFRRVFPAPLCVLP